MLKDLVALIPPPPKPAEAGRNNRWPSIEKKLGLALPRDYQDFISVYGTGLFANFIRVLNPFSANEDMSLLLCGKSICDIMRNLKASEGDDEVPFDVYPESNGIFPWGTDDNGNFLFWLTKGEPDRWPVVIGAGRSKKWDKFNIPMTAFLFKAMKREVRCSVWPKSYPRPKTDYVFESWPNGGQ